jgi:hypothetical protein
MPGVGDYGFNWLSPRPVCKKPILKDTVAFSTCVRQDDAFGLALEALSCRVDAQLK